MEKRSEFHCLAVLFVCPLLERHKRLKMTAEKPPPITSDLEAQVAMSASLNCRFRRVGINEATIKGSGGKQQSRRDGGKQDERLNRRKSGQDRGGRRGGGGSQRVHLWREGGSGRICRRGEAVLKTRGTVEIFLVVQMYIKQDRNKV